MKRNRTIGFTGTARHPDEAVLNNPRFLKNRYWPSALAWVSLTSPLGYAGYLAWQEQVYRESLRAVPAFAPISAVPARSPELFQPQAIATVLGLGVQDAWVASTEALQLQASIVSSQGVSQALLADAEGARFYAVGERLPGGSALRRIEASYVVLWRNGREERLTLKPASQYLIPAAATHTGPPATSLHLRPRAVNPRETQ